MNDVVTVISPLPMLLFCPHCGTQHIDAPNPAINWMDPPHKSHECQSCHYVWRPSDHPTTGVSSINTKGKLDCGPTDPSLAKYWGDH